MTAPAIERPFVDADAIEADIRTVLERHGLTTLNTTGVSVRVMTRGGIPAGVVMSASAHSDPFAGLNREAVAS